MRDLQRYTLIPVGQDEPDAYLELDPNGPWVLYRDVALSTPAHSVTPDPQAARETLRAAITAIATESIPRGTTAQVYRRSVLRRLDAALRAATPAEPGLSEAWARAEAALLEGWYFVMAGARGDGGYMAGADRASAPTEAELRRSQTLVGEGPTPTAALLALAARLEGGME